MTAGQHRTAHRHQHTKSIAAHSRSLAPADRHKSFEMLTRLAVLLAAAVASVAVVSAATLGSEVQLENEVENVQRECHFRNPRETVHALTVVPPGDVVFEAIDDSLRPTVLTYSASSDQTFDVYLLDFDQLKIYLRGGDAKFYDAYTKTGVSNVDVEGARLPRHASEDLVVMVKSRNTTAGTLVTLTVDASLDRYRLEYSVVAAVAGVCIGAVLLFLAVTQVFRKLHSITRKPVTFNSHGARGLDAAKLKLYDMFKKNSYEEDLIVEEFMPTISKKMMLARMAPIFLATTILLVFALPRSDRSSVNVVMIPVACLLIMNTAAVSIVLQQQALSVLYYSWLRYHVVIDFQNRDVWRNPGWILSLVCSAAMTLDMFVLPYNLSQAELVLVTRMNSTHLLNTTLLLLLLYRLYNYEAEMSSLNRLVEHHEVRARGASAKLTNSWEVLVITESDFKKYVADRQAMVSNFRRTQPDKIALQLRTLPFPQSRDDLEHWLFGPDRTRADVDAMPESFRWNAWWALKAMNSLGRYVMVYASMARLNIEPATIKAASAPPTLTVSSADKPTPEQVKAAATGQAAAGGSGVRKRSGSGKRRSSKGSAGKQEQDTAATPLLAAADSPPPLA